ncbi:hypothetical protein FEM48_Zijuj12G0076600 [Ziziphus jujuba var. spinosa]|uniref:Uncharacterized protein n=1 Tax=Ziziphus jujuba var. spinosa TaxID=714518 RepID=A0A978UC12_ZIZJJ|nr:hypothetical protein FEM48_Zijuj12G0076600 [Ziziphus jujuba var. spinosa]
MFFPPAWSSHSLPPLPLDFQLQSPIAELPLIIKLSYPLSPQSNRPFLSLNSPPPTQLVSTVTGKVAQLLLCQIATGGTISSAYASYFQNIVALLNGSISEFHVLQCFPAIRHAGAAGSYPLLNKVSNLKDAFWRSFKGPIRYAEQLWDHCNALVARALIENSNLIKWSLLFKAFSGLFALICGNGYIVGINQIYDTTPGTVPCSP